MNDLDGRTIVTRVTSNLEPISTESTLPELAVYPSEVKRIVVKKVKQNYLEPQLIKLRTNTFEIIERNFNEIYNTEFEEF